MINRLTLVTLGVCIVAALGTASCSKSDSTAPARGIANLALNQPARQSSVSQPYVAVKGVDGEYTGDGKTHSSFLGFHTAKEANPWWEVDLGGVHELTEVRIYNAEPFVRAASLKVLLSDDGGNWKEVYDNSGRTFGPAPLSVKLDKARAKFVRVQLAETTWLHLEEVEVYGN